MAGCPAGRSLKLSNSHFKRIVQGRGCLESKLSGDVHGEGRGRQESTEEGRETRIQV